MQKKKTINLEIWEEG